MSTIRPPEGGYYGDGPWSRDDSWLRRKRHGEKWPRFSAEVPPELAEALDEAQRKSIGGTSSATRANLVRAGLRLYLNTVDPEGDPPIESTAVEITAEDSLGIEETT